MSVMSSMSSSRVLGLLLLACLGADASVHAASQTRVIQREKDAQLIVAAALDRLVHGIQNRLE